MNERPSGESQGDAERRESEEQPSQRQASGLWDSEREPSKRSASTDPGRRRFLTWLWRLPVIAVVAGAGYAIHEAGHVLLGKQPAAAHPEFEPVEPVVIAPLAAFGEAWDEVTFDLNGRPAVAIRLPDPIVGGLNVDSVNLAGFSRVCTHQGCTVSLNEDTEAIAFGFNYRTDTPELVCPCHLSVFSPSKGGEPVSGPATLPLPRIELALEDDQVLAVGIETSAG